MLRKTSFVILILVVFTLPACAATNKTMYQQQVRAAEVGFRVYETVADQAAAKAAGLVKQSRTRRLVDTEKDTLRKIQGLAKALGSYKDLHNAYLGIVEFARKAQKNSVATDQEKKDAIVMAEVNRLKIEAMTQNLLKVASILGIETMPLR